MSTQRGVAASGIGTLLPTLVPTMRAFLLCQASSRGGALRNNRRPSARASARRMHCPATGGRSAPRELHPTAPAPWPVKSKFPSSGDWEEHHTELGASLCRDDCVSGPTPVHSRERPSTAVHGRHGRPRPTMAVGGQRRTRPWLSTAAISKWMESHWLEQHIQRL